MWQEQMQAANEHRRFTPQDQEKDHKEHHQISPHDAAGNPKQNPVSNQPCEYLFTRFHPDPGILPITHVPYPTTV